jgi:hypothetical protein
VFVPTAKEAIGVTGMESSCAATLHRAAREGEMSDQSTTTFKGLVKLIRETKQAIERGNKLLERLSSESVKRPRIGAALSESIEKLRQRLNNDLDKLEAELEASLKR